MKLLLISMFLWFNACSHVETVGFDRESNTVQIQANKNALPYYVEQEAIEYCGGPVKLLSMGQTDDGIMKVGKAPIYKTIKRNVYTYRCGG